VHRKKLLREQTDIFTKVKNRTMLRVSLLKIPLTRRGLQADRQTDRHKGFIEHEATCTNNTGYAS